MNSNTNNKLTRRSKTVSIKFYGKKKEEAAKSFMTWFIDGGGEDIILQVLNDNNINGVNMQFDQKKFRIEIDTN